MKTAVKRKNKEMMHSIFFKLCVFSAGNGTLFNVTCKLTRIQTKGTSTTGIAKDTITTTKNNKEGDTTPEGNDTTTQAALARQQNENESSGIKPCRFYVNMQIRVLGIVWFTSRYKTHVGTTYMSKTVHVIRLGNSYILNRLYIAFKTNALP